MTKEVRLDRFIVTLDLRISCNVISFKLSGPIDLLAKEGEDDVRRWNSEAFDTCMDLVPKTNA